MLLASISFVKRRKSNSPKFSSLSGFSPWRKTNRFRTVYNQLSSYRAGEGERNLPKPFKLFYMPGICAACPAEGSASASFQIEITQILFIQEGAAAVVPPEASFFPVNFISKTASQRAILLSCIFSETPCRSVSAIRHSRWRDSPNRYNGIFYNNVVLYTAYSFLFLYSLMKLHFFIIVFFQLFWKMKTGSSGKATTRIKKRSLWYSQS